MDVVDLLDNPMKKNRPEGVPAKPDTYRSGGVSCLIEVAPGFKPFTKYKFHEGNKVYQACYTGRDSEPEVWADWMMAGNFAYGHFIGYQKGKKHTFYYDNRFADWIQDGDTWVTYQRINGVVYGPAGVPGDGKSLHKSAAEPAPAQAAASAR
ncbi:hypothetical protein ACN20G_07345 [Streptomyces sp. BI20]|uniref:hypothetical protein n=1 Tax=Streptomyces sp. BI20 TaxID=3403460 RepID=UPI003C7370BA